MKAIPPPSPFLQTAAKRGHRKLMLRRVSGGPKGRQREREMPRTSRPTEPPASSPRCDISTIPRRGEVRPLGLPALDAPHLRVVSGPHPALYPFTGALDPRIYFRGSGRPLHQRCSFGRFERRSLLSHYFAFCCPNGGQNVIETGRYYAQFLRSANRPGGLR
jgi:hypothetical protein